ncbi:hypothetical protein PIB30_068634 [Stylosanthes scabra]|uniref:Uncharacterized protein n=1 Tax=Stylosanthes scabra TaxID=79078 RepID=A0ABU6UQ48_9FABA|nr:hypothetical protein [Stylosanthes scabra]
MAKQISTMTKKLEKLEVAARSNNNVQNNNCPYQPPFQRQQQPFQQPRPPVPPQQKPSSSTPPSSIEAALEKLAQSTATPRSKRDNHDTKQALLKVTQESTKSRLAPSPLRPNVIHSNKGELTNKTRETRLVSQVPNLTCFLPSSNHDLTSPCTKRDKHLLVLPFLQT